MREQLEPTEAILNAVLASIPDAVIVVDPKNRIIRNCNTATEKIFGYKKNNLIGRSTDQLHVDKRAHEIFGELSEKDLRQGKIFQGEFKMKKKDGTIINTYHTVRPIKEELGWQKGVVSIVRDISNQKKAEKQIEDNYKEKEVLLEEIHHRVKNNLALISSLLYLQMEKATNEQEKESLKMAYSRLQSIALVHEKSYQQAETDANINLNTYLPKLITSIEQTIKVPNKDIDTYIDASHISIPLTRAIPSCLLVSELLINAYKHAFKERNKGHIKIYASLVDDQINIQVKDNGVGLPEGFSLYSETLGMRIVQALKNQLDGKLTFTSNAGQGTTFSFLFPK